MKRTVYPLLSTRSVVMILGAMLLALAAVMLAIAVAPKKADAATQIVTKTFNKPAEILIPAGSDVTTGCVIGSNTGKAEPYPSEKSVSDFPAGSHIRDVNLTLRNFTHDNVPDDVDVLLVHRGVNRTVMSDVGNGNGVSNITLVLDDEATFFLPNSGDLGDGGSFKPRNAGELDDNFPASAPIQNDASALSGFDTLNPNGTWQLFVQDDAVFDCGEFGGGWSIRIRAAVPV